MGATEAGKGACLRVSVGCLGQWGRNQHAERISAEAGCAVGQVGTGYEGNAPSHRGRLETSKSKSAQWKVTVC